MDSSINNNHYGVCALCGKLGPLTFEHIPPKSSFNRTPVKTIAGESLVNHISDENRLPWDISGEKYVNNQKGSGLYSLCEECNNHTGHWYGGEYNKISQIASQIVSQNLDKNVNTVELLSVYPLRFIKQILSMFCSISGTNTKMQTIRDFVLDKDAVGIPKDKFKLCMFFTSSEIGRMFSMIAICINGPNGPQMQIVSEITSAPMGFILYMDPKPEHYYMGFDITELADYNYDDECDITVPILKYEINNTIPLDYKTKTEILELYGKS